MIPDVCENFVPQLCFSYTNCTSTGFIVNWTEFCCQPLSVRNTSVYMLSIIGSVGIIGTICNIMTIITFLYLYCFPLRIKRKFMQEFTMTQDPVFFLILHLSLCDFLHCIVGLPTFWTVYYHGYFPYSDAACKYSAFLRNSIAMADFTTLAVISAYFAWRRGNGRPRNQQFGKWPVIGVIACIWIYSFCIGFINLFEVCGGIGYDAVHGMCHILDCGECSRDSNINLPSGAPSAVLGIGFPFIVILISYSLVYTKLSEGETDVETWSQRRAVMILTFCYFIFILPLCVSALLPEAISSRAFIRVAIYSWYFLVYVVNFFIYVIFWRRVRTAMKLMLMDIMGIVERKQELEYSTSVWWSELQALSDSHLHKVPVHRNGRSFNRKIYQKDL